MLGPLAWGTGCAGTRLRNPVRLTLRNRTGAPVTGVLLRFDREIATVDVARVSGSGSTGAGDGDASVFARRRLRHHPADTLRLDRGVLAPGEAVSYRIAGRDGPPRVLEARWLVGEGRYGARIGDGELSLR